MGPFTKEQKKSLALTCVNIRNGVVGGGGQILVHGLRSIAQLFQRSNMNAWLLIDINAMYRIHVVPLAYLDMKRGMPHVFGSRQINHTFRQWSSTNAPCNMACVDWVDWEWVRISTRGASCDESQQRNERKAMLIICGYSFAF